MMTGYDHILSLFGYLLPLLQARHIAVRQLVCHRSPDHDGAGGLLQHRDQQRQSLIDAGHRLRWSTKCCNIGAFKALVWCSAQHCGGGFATLIFGLIHGLAWPPRSSGHEISPDGLVPNLLASLQRRRGNRARWSQCRDPDGTSYWSAAPLVVRYAYSANVWSVMSAGFGPQGHATDRLLRSNEIPGEHQRTTVIFPPTLSAVALLGIRSTLIAAVRRGGVALCTPWCCHRSTVESPASDATWA